MMIILKHKKHAKFVICDQRSGQLNTEKIEIKMYSLPLLNLFLITNERISTKIKSTYVKNIFKKQFTIIKFKFESKLDFISAVIGKSIFQSKSETKSNYISK